MAFELPQLPYAYDALEPYIDARTMEIHHSKHHNAYTTNLNAAAGTDMEGNQENILIIDLKNTVFNNGGGFYNHNLFWDNDSNGGDFQEIY
jgi:Fe-Mn family superoxide dismutase